MWYNLVVSWFRRFASIGRTWSRRLFCSTDPYPNVVYRPFRKGHTPQGEKWLSLSILVQLQSCRHAYSLLGLIQPPTSHNWRCSCQSFRYRFSSSEAERRSAKYRNDGTRAHIASWSTVHHFSRHLNALESLVTLPAFGIVDTTPTSYFAY